MKFIQYSKRILTFCAFALLLQSTTVSQAAAWETFKEKAESVTDTVGGTVKKGAQEFASTFSGMVDTISSKARAKLSETYSKMRSYDRKALFNTVARKLESAGTRIRRIANCIVSGQECSTADRVILLGTATFIFVALLVLAGTSLTVAAQAEIIEKAKEKNEQQTKGYSAQAMVERLSNMVKRGKDRFLSLKEAIIKGQLTKNQRKFLISFGSAIIGATIVTAAALTGLTIYSQQQEAKKAAEIAKKQEMEQLITEEAPITPITTPLTASAEELAKPIVIGGIAAAAGNFGKLFDKVIRIDESGRNIFQRTFKKVTKKLEKKTELAKKAVASVGEKKNELVEKAKKAYEDAVNSANELISQIKGASSVFINDALKALFDIDYDDIKKAIGIYNTVQANLLPKVYTLSELPTWNQLISVQNNWNAIQTKGYVLWQNLSTFLWQFIARTQDPLRGYAEELGTPQRAKLLKKYPLAFKFDYLRKIYPQFIESVLFIDLPYAGNAAEQMLDQTGKMFQDIADIYSRAGIWGKLLLTNEMIDPLRNIGKYMQEVGKNLKEFANSEPLAQLIKEIPKKLEETPLKKWLTRVIWAPKESISSIKDIIQNQMPQMMEANEQLIHALQQTTKLSNTFVIHSANMWVFIKQTMIQELSKKPFQNYLNLAKQAVLQEATISKELFNDVLLYTASSVNYLNKLLTPLISMVEHVNNILDKQLITPENIAQLKDSTAKFKAMTSELARLRNAAKEQLGIGK